MQHAARRYVPAAGSGREPPQCAGLGELAERGGCRTYRNACHAAITELSRPAASLSHGTARAGSQREGDHAIGRDNGSASKVSPWATAMPRADPGVGSGEYRYQAALVPTATTAATSSSAAPSNMSQNAQRRLPDSGRRVSAGSVNRLEMPDGAGLVSGCTPEQILNPSCS